MDSFADIQTIQTLCRQYDIRPTRGAGQNFLIEPQMAKVMVDSAQVKKSDTILEIGPGLGALTVVLARNAGQVVAVEKDPHLFRAAEKILEGFKNVQLINGDILKISNFQFPISKKIPNSNFQIPNSGYKLVANLPYSITSAVLRKFTEEEPKPDLIMVMVQKEVAERVCAKPRLRQGSGGRGGEMSLLSVAMQFYAEPEIVRVVSRDCFWPVPEVDSAILKLKVHKVIKFIKSKEDKKKFFQIVRIGFSSRRKQLQNNLSAGLRLSNDQIKDVLAKAGFDPQVRAQDLAVGDWARLLEMLKSLELL